MNATTPWQNSIVPAQLAYLAIYSPTLGPTDETFDQQLVFYYSRVATESKATQRKQGKAHSDTTENTNEQLRQIGLAQGLVDFARTFSNGKPVDSVETEKSRIILHQLEDGWWLLASIDLTRITINDSTSTPNTKTPSQKKTKYEYSSREVSPPALLTQQIKQAHSIFTLHHGPSLQTLHTKLSRERFCGTLDRFWTRFARSWRVLLHGNPSVDSLHGIKLASGGELGYSVGEEEWGSGERDVLEAFTSDTEGLIDTVVARYGDVSSSDEEMPWTGAGSNPSVSDGIIFGGIGGITRESLQSVSMWMRHIYTYGDYAYGVRDNPARERRKRRRRNMSTQMEVTQRSGQPTTTLRNRSSSRSLAAGKTTSDDVQNRPQVPDRVATQDYAINAAHPGIPPPIVSAAEAALDAATKKADSKETEPVDDDNTTLGIPDQYLKYLTLGLSTFAKPTKPPIVSRTSTSSSKTLVQEHMSIVEPIPDGDAAHARLLRQRYHEDKGHFIIGMKGDLDNVTGDEDAELTEGSFHDATDNRIILRTVYVYTKQNAKEEDGDSDDTVEATPESKLSRVRVLIYAHRPFLYCFLFEQRTDSLSYTTFYRKIHNNLTPIHKSLLSSTQPSSVAARIDAARENASSGEAYDLLYDPLRLTIHASVPDIPDPGSLAAEGIVINDRVRQSTDWSRLDALNVHNAILSTLKSVEDQRNAIERTSRTARDWYIIWMRLQASDKDSSKDEIDNTDTKHGPDLQGRIAIIVRKAKDTSKHPSTTSRAASGMWASLGMSTTESPVLQDKIMSTGGSAFDAKKYVESLLSLNR